MVRRDCATTPKRMPRTRTTAHLIGCVLFAWAALAHADPLGSWREGQSKRALVRFVEDATTRGGPRWIDPRDRIAVFDNDGTLWSEQPLYFQAMFALDRLRELAPQHPDWRNNPVLAAGIDGDQRALAAAGSKGMLEIVAATHAGMTSDEFSAVVRRWLDVCSALMRASRALLCATSSVVWSMMPARY